MSFEDDLYEKMCLGCEKERKCKKSATKCEEYDEEYYRLLQIALGKKEEKEEDKGVKKENV